MTEPTRVHAETLASPLGGPVGDAPRHEMAPLLTSTVGSYARPSWLVSGLAAAERGEYGSLDLEEMLDDAVDMALRDQEDAGIDVVSDGEMRRVGFFTAEFYRHLTGLRPLPPDRRLGAAGHDQQHRFEVLEPITAPHGLGVVAEFEYARGRTRRPLKMTLPGPFTLSGRLINGPGRVYPDRIAAAWAFVPIVNAEVRALEAAGATFIQVDEPSPAIHPDAPVDFAALFNAAVEGVAVRRAAHLCFGNYMGRPLAKRTYRPVLDQILRFDVDELVLEFANRELAELEVAGEIARHYDVAAGVVDVKNSYVESPEDVAERTERLLAQVPAERLALVPDCGFSQTARAVARAKLKALVAGRDLVRGVMSGGSTGASPSF
jgi:5-methyltetrahydropteroyltriglutamate--homocysteine methyltransferase